MGFFDKVKDAGKGALKGAMIMAAKSYATSTFGKHKLCKISMNSTYDKITFVKGPTIEAEYVIKDSIKTFRLMDENEAENYHVIELIFNDGEKSSLHLTVNADQGSATADPVAARYETPSYLVKALAQNVPEINDATKQWVNKFMERAGKKAIFE